MIYIRPRNDQPDNGKFQLLVHGRKIMYVAECIFKGINKQLTREKKKKSNNSVVAFMM